MQAHLPRVLAAAALGGVLLSIQAPAPAATDPSATFTTTGCTDGAETATVHLTAADGADTSFTTTVTGNQGEVLNDSDHVVPAGTTIDVATPALGYGPYAVDVRAGKKRVLTDLVQVRCVPTADYKNPGFGTVDRCDNTISYLFSNEPIKGAGGDLLPVKFRVSVRLHGVYTVHTFSLPESDADPYTHTFTFTRTGGPARVRYTADGRQLVVSSSGTEDCAADPQPLPNTGF